MSRFMIKFGLVAIIATGIVTKSAQAGPGGGWVPPVCILGQTAWYYDSDGDGYGTNSTKKCSRTRPGANYVINGGDCDETVARGLSVYPGAPDDWYDGIDSNCDGANDMDRDGDGYAASKTEQQSYTGLSTWIPSLGCTASSSSPCDCDDGNSAINPGVIDDNCDAVDDNCSNTPDDDYTGTFTSWYRDQDLDGYGDAVAGLVLQTCVSDPNLYDRVLWVCEII